MINDFPTLKQITMLSNVKNCNQYKVCKASDVTYSYGVFALREFHKRGWIEVSKEGRIKRVTLTDSGQEIVQKSRELIKLWRTK